MSGSLAQTSDRDMESKFGQMAQCMKAGGKLIKRTVKVDLFMLMETSMMAIGRMIKHMVSEFIAILMEPDTKDSGKKINNTERVWKLGPMVQVTEEITSKVGSMEEAASHGLTEAPILGNLLKIILKAKAHINGQMADNMRDNGKITRWRDMGYSPGRMAEDTRVNTLTIKRKVKVFSTGQMEGSTKAIGKMVSSMASVSIPQLLARPKKENGEKARELLGSAEHII